MNSVATGLKYGLAELYHLVQVKWALVLLVSSIVLSIGSVIQSRSPKLYSNSVQIEILEEDADEFGLRASTEVEIASRSAMGRAVASLHSSGLLIKVVDRADLAKRWGVEGDAKALVLLRNRLTITPSPARKTVRLTILGNTPREAAVMANLVAETFLLNRTAESEKAAEAQVASLEASLTNQRAKVARIGERIIASNVLPDEHSDGKELRRQLVTANNLLRSFEAKHQAAMTRAENPPPLAMVRQEALPEDAVRLGSFWSSLILLTIVGLILGIACAAVTTLGKRKWIVLERVSEKLGVSVIARAKVGRDTFLDLERPLSHLIEPYRDLRTRLHRLPAGECMVVTMLSDNIFDGSTPAIANLACVYADAGRSVLVIDGNTRNPQLHKALGASPHPGLTDYLSGEMRREETVLQTRRANFWFMPSGPAVADPSSLIAGKRMDDLIWDMKSRFDLILIQSPSIHRYAEAGSLVSQADHSVIVNSYANHSIARLSETRMAIKAASGNLSGVLLTDWLPGEKPVRPGAQQNGDEFVVPTVDLKRSIGT